MTVNVVNPSKHNSDEDLKTGALPVFQLALKYWKAHYECGCRNVPLHNQILIPSTPVGGGEKYPA